MLSRQNLLESIAELTADYRTGELAPVTPEHVDRWAKQFAANVQLPILSEINHVLKSTYLSRNKVSHFLSAVTRLEKLTGSDPRAFWRSVSFLDIQTSGSSQREMLGIFDNLLRTACGLGVDECSYRGTQATFVYLDDAVFTGSRILQDLTRWIRGAAPRSAIIHVILVALHRGGMYHANRQVLKAAKTAGKTISLTWWKAIGLEDRLAYINISDVLRPVSIPNLPDVQQYVQGMTRAPKLRLPCGVVRQSLFSSEQARNLLEQEFLKAGVRIRRNCQTLDEFQRPLGHSKLETLGFGSLIVTFRNCPNNAPLALWAGAPWYPLFERKPNRQHAYTLDPILANNTNDAF